VTTVRRLRSIVPFVLTCALQLVGCARRQEPLDARFPRPQPRDQRKWDFVHAVREVSIPDTVKFGQQINGDVLLQKDAGCHILGVEWTHFQNELWITVLGTMKPVAECPSNHFRVTIGSAPPPWAKTDEPWEGTPLRVVACQPKGAPWRRVVVLMVPKSALQSRYGMDYSGKAKEQAARILGDSAKRLDRRYCDSRTR
jgi:hypothetical protein